MRSLLRSCAALLLAASLAHAALTTDIEYGRAGGESLKLDAYVPSGAGPFPAVILVHGGGWTSGDKSGGPKKALIAPMQEPLERAGFAWFSIDYRLAPAHRYPACIEDVETAIRWVRAHATEYRLDPGRLALAGESAGGHLAALAAVRTDESTRVAAVVVFYGVLDLPGMQPPGAPLRPNFAALFGRDRLDDELRAQLRAASPIQHVRPGLPPFLLLHGTADARVPLEQSSLFKVRLAEAGVPCELVTIPQGNHGMTGWGVLAPGFKDQVVTWLQRTLAAR